ncbi:MAG: hypothetical protein AAF800_01270 [Planctomycetota bacterium]
MKNLPALFNRVRRTATRLHRDERGAEGLEKLLIIAAIVLPLLGLLIVFRKEMQTWATDRWSEVNVGGGSDDAINTDPTP